MKTVKNISFILLALLAIEYAVYLYSANLSSETGIQMQLAARYSARVSLGIFVVLFVWVGLNGLKKIYADEGLTAVFKLGLLTLAINHLLHFAFLYRTHELMDWDLYTARSAGGGLVYVILTLMPLWLWEKKELVMQVYWAIVTCFASLSIVFLVGYIGRWNRDLPFESSKEIYISLAVMVGLVFALNTYRVVKELKLND